MKFIAAVLVSLALVGVGVAIGAAADGDWGPRHDAVVVSNPSGTTDTGQTIVVADGHWGHGFFFFPFGFLFFLLLFLLVVSAFRRGHRRGPWDGSGPRWLDDWHRRAHEGESAPESTERPSGS
jgi:hypothetical protein